MQRSVPSLQNLCLIAIARNLRIFAAGIQLPSPLLAELLSLLIKKRRLNDRNVLKILAPASDELPLAGCTERLNVSALVAHCPRVRHLNLRNCMWVDDTRLQCFATAYSATLEHLDVSFDKKITDDGVCSLTTCSALTALDLSWTRVSDRGLRALAQHCTALTALNLSRCSLLGCDALATHVAAPYSPSLRPLPTSLSAALSTFSLGPPTSPASPAAALAPLALNSPPLVPRSALTGLQPCSLSQPQPPQLYAQQAPQLASNSLSCAEQPPQTASLHVQHALRQQPQQPQQQQQPPTPTTAQLSGVDSILARCTRLWSLQLRNLPARMSGTLAVRSHTLTHLVVAACDDLPAEAFARIDCPRLQHLCVSTCPQFTDAALESILARCGSSLLFLDASHTPLRAPSFRHASALRALILNGCAHLIADAFASLARSCVRVEALELRDCSNFDDVCAARLAGASSLRRIELSRCARLTDDGVSVLLRNCYNLTHVGLAFCSLLSDRVLDEIARIASSLFVPSPQHSNHSSRSSSRRNSIAGPSFVPQLGDSFAAVADGASSPRAIHSVSSGDVSLAHSPSASSYHQYGGGLSARCSNENLSSHHSSSSLSASPYASATTLTPTFATTTTTAMTTATNTLLVPRCHQLERLKLFGCNNVTPTALLRFENVCSGVQLVTVRDTRDWSRLESV